MLILIKYQKFASHIFIFSLVYLIYDNIISPWNSIWDGVYFVSSQKSCYSFLLLTVFILYINLYDLCMLSAFKSGVHSRSI